MRWLEIIKIIWRHYQARKRAEATVRFYKRYMR